MCDHYLDLVRDTIAYIKESSMPSFARKEELLLFSLEKKREPLAAKPKEEMSIKSLAIEKKKSVAQMPDGKNAVPNVRPDFSNEPLLPVSKNPLKFSTSQKETFPL